MKSYEELTQGCAELLKNLRKNLGLSVNKMAELMYVDRRTWQRYEDGDSAPTVPEFLQFFSISGESAMKSVLDFLYPDVYQGLTEKSDVQTLREAAAHFFLEVAPEKVVREWDYIMFSEHGSNSYPQLQEFTMLDHLPLEDRLIVANLIYHLYRIADLKGELVGTNHVMPDVKSYVEAMEKGRDAVLEHLNSYTTI